MSSDVNDFTISVPEEVLANLKTRLRQTRWPDQIPDSDWVYGTDLTYLQDLCAYWAEEFDWRKVEKRLNSWRNITTEIDGQKVHAIVAESENPEALPLLITHGWPGSVTEFLHVIDPLVAPGRHGGDPATSFHVVAPSLPGFGWSGPTTEPGWDVKRIAEAWAELMAKLGYDRYGAQGGDWGGFVSTWLGLVDPEHLAGIHLNMAVGFPTENGLSEQEATDLAEMEEFMSTGTAYQEIQGKNPQTLGYAMNDSPAGLAGWIVEKFLAWTDNKGNPEDAVDRDQLLANLTTYWVTETANSSFRIYYETMKAGRWATQDSKVEVPTGVAIFPKEIVKPPRSWLEAAYDLKRYTRFDRGGHFAAMEEPELLVDDIRAFFEENT